MTDEPTLSHAPSARLAELLHCVESSDWSEQDIASIYQHFLHSPVELDLSPPRSLHQILIDPLSAESLLIRIKQFAQAWREQPDVAVPAQVASVVYWLAVAAARVHAGRTISSLGVSDILKGLEWSGRCSWTGADERDLLRRAVGLFSGQAMCDSGGTTHGR
jgi:hypothetical protein